MSILLQISVDSKPYCRVHLHTKTHKKKADPEKEDAWIQRLLDY